MIYLLTLRGEEHRAEVKESGDGAYRVVLDGVEHRVSARRTESSIYSIILGPEGGPSFEADVEIAPEEVVVAIRGEKVAVGAVDERRKQLRTASGAGESAGEIHSPMPGKLVKILAPPGTAVKRGQGVVVVEAMKMENELGSPKDGVVKAIHVAEGKPVEGGTLLAVVE